jgi:hypothetical protein
MEMFQKVGLSVIGSAQAIWGFFKLDSDWQKGIITMGIGIAVIVIAAVLNKKGIPVGKQ